MTKPVESSRVRKAQRSMSLECGKRILRKQCGRHPRLANRGCRPHCFRSIRFPHSKDMLRCAFLTLDDSSGFVIDDELAYPPLAALGWRVEAISWRTTPCDWRAYDAVVIRSTWDYIADPDAGLNRRSRK